MTEHSTIRARLEAILEDCAPAAVAVSGGVDSMTLAHIAHRCLGEKVTMFHAVSPAVPPAATARVRGHAEFEGWRLEIDDAREFHDENYLANPANRCFFCKTNLYGTLARRTSDQLLSGTNLDDLSDWRPGLEAAEGHAVRHPFVEARVDKAGVRALARDLRLDDIAELPSAPCLSSRVETGIRINADMLTFVDATEALLRNTLAPAVVRCRIRQKGVTVELDEATLVDLDSTHKGRLVDEIGQIFGSRLSGPVTFDVYRRGSAFLREQSHG